MRFLSTEESELWARVAATIRPLSRDPMDAKVLQKPSNGQARSAPEAGISRRPTRSGAGPTGIGHKTLDGSWEKKLKGGNVQPDRVLDLHGMNLDAAWRAIDRVLEQSIASGDRLVLLITGHHRPSEPPIERGRIRAVVQDWLAASRHANSIAAVRGAHRRHGGGGSLYLILRRGPRAR